MMPLQPTPPTVNTSSLNNNWFGGAQDFLKFGLDSWMQVEQINKLKDSGTVGREEVLNTVQSPTKNTTAQVDAQGNAKGYDAKMLNELMQKGGLILGGTVAVVALLYFLTNRK